MDITTDTRPVISVWDLPTPPLEEWAEAGWFPLPEANHEQLCVVLRPHICWGPMPMQYVEGRWISSDYAMTYPDDAFEPYWKPMPEQPMRKRG